MRPLAGGLLTVSFALLALAAAPTDAAAKCGATPGGTVLPGYVLIIDGELIGEFAMNEPIAYPPAEQIVHSGVVCLRARGAAEPNTRQAAVVVITKRGAQKVLTSYLRDLVAAQEDHRSSTGEYARGLSELDFLDSHIVLPLEMEVGDTGFAATASLAEAGVACRVALGEEAREPRAKSESGDPVCSRR